MRGEGIAAHSLPGPSHVLPAFCDPRPITGLNLRPPARRGDSQNALPSEVGPGTGTWSRRISGSPRLRPLSGTFYCRRSLVMGRTAYLLAAEGPLCPGDPGPIPVSILAQSELGSRGRSKGLSPTSVAARACGVSKPGSRYASHDLQAKREFRPVGCAKSGRVTDTGAGGPLPVGCINSARLAESASLQGESSSRTARRRGPHPRSRP